MRINSRLAMPRRASHGSSATRACGSMWSTAQLAIRSCAGAKMSANAGGFWFAKRIQRSTKCSPSRRGGIPDDFVCEDAALPRLEGEHFVDRWIRFANQNPPAFADILAPAQERIASCAVLHI